jgi:hypothetical protein
MSKGSAFGKAVIFDDQFAFEKAPAIVPAIPFEPIAEAELSRK